MDLKLPPLALESGLDLRQIITTGSLLQINDDYDDHSCESNEREFDGTKLSLYIGVPVTSFKELRKQLINVDENGFVNKKILEEGGGMQISDDCTVYVAYSGFWEREVEPFDIRRIEKPLVVHLKDNGLLPGLQIAIKSMLVGEMSVFLLSSQVMYGELGVPPRIRPKAECVFYIKLIKSINNPIESDIDPAEANTFRRVHTEVKMLYSSGVALYKVKNNAGAIQLFRKGIFMLHKCRLANETEERLQEKLLIKLYINLAICYNKIKQPLKACTACNELNRLNSLWNNGKALFQNAKALRMISDFKAAEKKLKRAIKLCPGNDEMEAEYELLKKLKISLKQNKLTHEGTNLELVSAKFKEEVENLVKHFKESDELCKLTLPSKLNTAETEYVRDICIRENLFFNKTQRSYLLDKNEEDMIDQLSEIYLEDQNSE